MILRLALLLCVIPLASCKPADDTALLEEKSAAGLDQGVAVVTTPNGTHEITVEIARTDKEQAYGLMNRQSLDPDRGMIFPYDPPQDVSFWMRDTFIPLDLIFIAPGGKIARIEASAVPLSLEPIPSGQKIEAVLEIAGGRAEELMIAPGDRIVWPH
ncbi:MAG: DUF192 domain-containing protein [Sphingomicrobium sp.]